MELHSSSIRVEVGLAAYDRVDFGPGEAVDIEFAVVLTVWQLEALVVDVWHSGDNIFG